ncbi:MAG TPA: hypothetical protein VN426_12570 [Syntrophomonadaceae bacterium]|nr:hypothetical protein [Syntrophomonadaceae bacterium]
MNKQVGTVVSKQSFLKGGGYAKEEYEGLLVSADVENGVYNIGVQLQEDRVLVVDQAKDSEVHHKLHEWVPRIQEVQNLYDVGKVQSED